MTIRVNTRFKAGIGLAILGSFGLIACTTVEESQLLSEDPAYATGFGDGCVTATEEAKSFSTKRVRDEYQFEQSRAYRAGWRQGYLDCGSRELNRNDGGRVLGDDPGF